MPEQIHVSVIFAASPERIFLREMELPQGATVGDAIEASGVRSSARMDEMQLGIFSRKTTLAAKLRDGDRVEIYRPLKIDPKDARRKRASGNAG